MRRPVLFAMLAMWAYHEALAFAGHWRIAPSGAAAAPGLTRGKMQKLVSRTIQCQRHKKVLQAAGVSAALPAVRVTMFCTSLLVLKVLLASVMVGMAKFKVGARAPEDAPLYKKYGDQDIGVVKPSASAEDVALLRRWERILANDLENIPMAMITSWGCLLCMHLFGSGAKSAAAYQALVLGFTLFRCIFTWAFACRLQPWRSLSWTAGLACQLGLAALGCASSMALLS